MLRPFSTAALAVAVMLLGAGVFPGMDAKAYDAAVRQNCKADYLQHCSQHAVGSPGVRACMRNVGPNLSPSCINALVKSGEAGKAASTPQPVKADVGGGLVKKAGVTPNAKAAVAASPAQNGTPVKAKKGLGAKQAGAAKGAASKTIKKTPGAKGGKTIAATAAGKGTKKASLAKATAKGASVKGTKTGQQAPGAKAATLNKTVGGGAVTKGGAGKTTAAAKAPGLAKGAKNAAAKGAGAPVAAKSAATKSAATKATKTGKVAQKGKAPTKLTAKAAKTKTH